LDVLRDHSTNFATDWVLLVVELKRANSAKLERLYEPEDPQPKHVGRRDHTGRQRYVNKIAGFRQGCNGGHRGASTVFGTVLSRGRGAPSIERGPGHGVSVGITALVERKGLAVKAPR
jgi:hypothetical protein